MLEPGTCRQVAPVKDDWLTFFLSPITFLQVPTPQLYSPKCPEPPGMWIWGLSQLLTWLPCEEHFSAANFCVSAFGLLCVKENKSGSVNSLILSASFSFNKVVKIIDELWNSDLKWLKRCPSPVMENIRFGVRQTNAKILALASANCVFFIYGFLTLLFCKLEMFLFCKVYFRIMKTRCICSLNKYLLSTTMARNFS